MTCIYEYLTGPRVCHGICGIPVRSALAAAAQLCVVHGHVATLVCVPAAASFVAFLQNSSSMEIFLRLDPWRNYLQK